MSKWATIDKDISKYRLLCKDTNCNLSMCNIIKGMLHLSNIHSSNRHSIALSHEDMLFVISQYLNSLNKQDRRNILEFFNTFD